MPVRQRDNNMSLSKADTLLDFIHGHPSSQYCSIVEKAPFGLKPLGSLFGGGDKKLSPEEEAEEKVPEGQRVYVDSKEEAPDGVDVLTGKREGLFYDMNQLNQKDHGDTITDVFNDLVDQHKELLSEEGGQKAEEATYKLQGELSDMEAEASANHKDAGKLNALSDEVAEAVEAYIRDDPAGKGFDSPEFKAVEALGDKEEALRESISSDVNEQLKDTSTPEGKAYTDKAREAIDSAKNKQLDKIRQKMGNALIHSFKSNGFKVDDMDFNIDPDMSYVSDEGEWERRSIEKIRDAFKEFQEQEGNTPEEFEKAWRENLADHLKNPETSYLSTVMGVLDENDIAAYFPSTNEFHANPKVFEAFSGNEPKEKIEAMSTMVHESLHSIDAKQRQVSIKKHVENKGRDWTQEAKIRGLSPSKIRQKAYENTKILFEEAPVELLSKAIVGDKYYSDLKGRDVYTDPEFTEGKGGREEHSFEGYREVIPHVARWALGQSKGSPSKARALLGEMRELATGEGSKNLQRMNELSISYGSYLDDYAKQAPSLPPVGGEGGVEVWDNGYHTHGAIGFSPSSVEKKDQFPLHPRPTTMEGWGGQESTSIRDARPTHDEDGNISKEAHLDIMHLLYGKG